MSYFKVAKILPEEGFLPPQLVLSDGSFQNVVNMIENPPPPTEAILELMNDDSDSPSSKEKD